MERQRRDVLPTDSEGGTDPNPNDGPAPYLGPYSYPMFSGKIFIRLDFYLYNINKVHTLHVKGEVSPNKTVDWGKWKATLQTQQ